MNIESENRLLEHLQQSIFLQKILKNVYLFLSKGILQSKTSNYFQF